MKKLLTALAVSAFGIALGTFVSLANNERALAANADACITTPGIEYMQGQNRARAQVDLEPGCGTRTFVMKTWYAKSLDDGTQEFHDTQWLMDTGAKVTLRPSDPPTFVKVQLDDKSCFHQVDLVDVTNPNNPKHVAAKIGGTRDCRPEPTMTCDAFDVTKSANRTVTVSNFKYTATNATLKSVVVNWGDGSTVSDTTPVGQSHQYSQNGTYNIQATLTFSHTNRVGNTVEKTRTCAANVTFTADNPGNQQVCEISTGNIVTIPAGSYDTNVYAPVNDPRCKAQPGNQHVCEFSTGKVVEIPGGSYDTTKYGPVDDPKCKTTVTTTSTPPTTPTAELTKTGPGAVAALFGAASVLGTAGHMIVSRRRS